MVARLVSFVAMGLAGLGGMLIGLDTTIDPLIGSRPSSRSSPRRLSGVSAAFPAPLSALWWWALARNSACWFCRRPIVARSDFSPSCWC